MPAYFRLQDLTTVTTDGPQRIEEAIDVGSFGTLVEGCPGNPAWECMHAGEDLVLQAAASGLVMRWR